MTKGKALSQQELIGTLSPVIRGWGNYYSHVVSKKVFCTPRREFERAKTENVFWANFGLASYQIIYSVEEQIKELGLTGVEKVAYRKANAEIAWRSLLSWCVFTVNDVPEKSQMHKACNYVIHSSL